VLKKRKTSNAGIYAIPGDVVVLLYRDQPVEMRFVLAHVVKCWNDLWNAEETRTSEPMLEFKFVDYCTKYKCLNLLKWNRLQNHKASTYTCTRAAYNNDVEAITWGLDNGFSLSYDVFKEATENGNSLNTLK
jgi:hypothetical protein